ncbi:transmembrane protein 256 homolog [Drosophila subpulchrella]|uniref:transmembrane protein 256 homolog n=1 Tax=Drosophila subpulchrella TaxID=1486046 RepID=UPI0018A19259|nr:transmembrane protein 256 homolog [Drosophila subpulchrella]
MSVADTIEYVTLGNPVSKMVASSASALLRTLGLRPKKVTVQDTNISLVPSAQSYGHSHGSLYGLAGSHYHFVRLAGIGGASAIFMGAYCKYVLKDVSDPKEQVDSQAFADVANRIHFLHSFAMMAMPLAHYPVITGTLMITGTMLFSGCMYYRALTGEKKLQPYATVGGFCLMAAWLTLVL